MGTPIRVLVIHDSVNGRKALADAIHHDRTLELAGTAPNAAIALQKIPQLNPDVALLDIGVDADGFETARLIRTNFPNLPVLVSDGAEGDILPKLKSAAGRSAPPHARRVVGALPTVIAIGSSTGGPNALSLLLRQLPAGIRVPILIVQHMPVDFTRMFAERLDASTRLPTKEAEDGELVLAGHVYIAPGDQHVSLARRGNETRIVLHRGAPENSCRPAVDVLFRSVATTYGAGALATVLTGMGRDGTRGARAIVDAGGTVIVQEPSSCVVPSMPLNVVNEGCSSGAYDPERLGRELLSRVQGPSQRRSA